MTTVSDRDLVQAAGTLGVELSRDRAAKLLRYLEAMLAENQKVNLTAIRDPAQALVLHVLDSLAAGLVTSRPQRIADLGSGNGFPGVALAQLWPSAQVTLLERTQKKCAAIERALSQAQITGVQVLCIDIEQAPSLRPELRHHFDLLAARALEQPTAVAKMAAPLSAEQAQLLLWLDAESNPNASLPGGFDRVAWWPYELPDPAARQRRLAEYRRVRRM